MRGWYGRRHLIRPSVSTGAPSPQGEGLRRWGATPYHCNAIPMLHTALATRCRSKAIRCLRSSIPNQRVTKLCHADAGRFYATAPLCISRTLHCLGVAFALPRLALPRRCNSTALLSKSTALGFHATAPRSAIPEHRNADAICCFSYAVYYVAFAMPHQSHARPKLNYS